MAKKRGTGPLPSRGSVSLERVVRLYRLLELLGANPQSRETLRKRLRLDVRGFYRDLEFLRECGIHISSINHHYSLEDDWRSALVHLPFPDPGLTLGEAQQLARGRSAVHRKLKVQIAQIGKRLT
jgi:predicted DNA-binding transcriptional regulator YafY